MLEFSLVLHVYMGKLGLCNKGRKFDELFSAFLSLHFCSSTEIEIKTFMCIYTYLEKVLRTRQKQWFFVAFFALQFKLAAMIPFLNGLHQSKRIDCQICQRKNKNKVKNNVLRLGHFIILNPLAFFHKSFWSFCCLPQTVTLRLAVLKTS